MTRARPSAVNCLSFLFVVVCVNDDWKSLMKADSRVIKTDARAMEVDSLNKKGSYACVIILQIQVL
jgi:hypothetical protein